MNRFAVAALFAACASFVLPASAQVPQQAYGTPSPTAATYNDPAMSFTAPPGYVKANIPAHDPAKFDGPTMVAAFMKASKNGPRSSITIQIENFDGTLDDFESSSENDLRGQGDSVFIRKSQTTLSNGMPAFWRHVTVGTGFDQLERYEYIWVDGLRGIELSLTARNGDVTEAQAKLALANATGVAYPQRDF